MNYQTKDMSDIITSKKVEIANILQCGQTTCELFHLFKDNSLHIDKEESDPIDNTKLFYMVLKGNIEICFPQNRLQLHQYESIEIEYGNDATSFDLYAKSETDLLYIVISAEIDLNTDMHELKEKLNEQEEREPYVKKHNFRVSKYAGMMMQIVDPEYNIKDLQFGASFHDIGKLYIPKEILHKPGKLTYDEYEIIKKHSIYSYEMLLPYTGEKIAKIARQHHEKLDGSGYPDGIKGDEILKEAKVIAVADIFDALTSCRCYRKSAFSFQEALHIIEEDVNADKLDKDSYYALKKLVDNGILKEGEDNL